VGDLTDRGPESSAVLDVVQRYGIRAVCGNHEQGILDWALRDDIDPEMVEVMRDDPAQAIAEWSYRDGCTSQLVYNGSQWFVELYAKTPTRPTISCATSLRCPMLFRFKPHTD
jgi:serine/threonine protein phosphatase 1